MSDHAPDHPPKTPPPPKRPVSPPRPETSFTATPLARKLVRNRRSANWQLASAPWTPRQASAHVLLRPREWGFREAGRAAAELTELLVRTAVADGGRRVSVHLAGPGAPGPDRRALAPVGAGGHERHGAARTHPPRRCVVRHGHRRRRPTGVGGLLPTCAPWYWMTASLWFGRRLSEREGSDERMR